MGYTNLQCGSSDRTRIRSIASPDDPQTRAQACVACESQCKRMLVAHSKQKNVVELYALPLFPMFCVCMQAFVRAIGAR